MKRAKFNLRVDSATDATFTSKEAVFKTFMVGLLFAGPCTSIFAADFPALKEQIDSTVLQVGTNDCATQRTGVWLVEGGVVVQIRKPQKMCTFEVLQLIVDGEPIQSSAFDSAFYCKTSRYGGGSRCEWYRGDVGKVFFKTDRTVDPKKIIGIKEPNCIDNSCLNEDAAIKIAK